MPKTFFLLNLFLGVAGLSAQPSPLFVRKACKEVAFFGTVEERFDQIRRLEPGFYTAFQPIGERSYPYIGTGTTCTGTHCSKLIQPTNCTVDYPLDNDRLATHGVARVMADYQWYDGSRSLHHEGFQVSFSFSLASSQDPKSIRLLSSAGFTICRTRDTCTKMVNDAARLGPGSVEWSLISK